MELYVIGPVTGRENLNREAFEDAKEKLERAGYAVTIPNDIILPDASREQAMRLSISWIAKLDRGGVAMLDDWAKSPGATLENRVATACGMQVHCVDTWLRMAGVDPEDDNSPEEEQDPPSDGTRAPSNEFSDALTRRMDETNALLRAIFMEIGSLNMLVSALMLNACNGPKGMEEDATEKAALAAEEAVALYESAGKENNDDREA